MPPKKKTTVSKTVKKTPAKKVETGHLSKGTSNSAVLHTVLFIVILLLGISASFNLQSYLQSKMDETQSTAELSINVEKVDNSVKDAVDDANPETNTATDQAINFTIVQDSGCTACADISNNQNIHQAFPSAIIKVIDIATDPVPAGIKSVPTIITDKSIEGFSDFERLKAYLEPLDGDRYEMPIGILGINSNKIILDTAILPQVENNGKLVVVEYSEFACPFCKRFAEETEKPLEAKYGDKIEIDFRNFIVHEQARPAAIAHECVKKLGSTDQAVQMHDKIFANQQDLSEKTLLIYADDLGIDIISCMDDPEIDALIRADQEEGKRAGVSGTPGFIIDNIFISGAQPMDVFEKAIDSVL